MVRWTEGATYLSPGVTVYFSKIEDHERFVFTVLRNTTNQVAGREDCVDAFEMCSLYYCQQ